MRLYFRPKTPTQYYAEGIYSQTTLSMSKFPEAHCPVPVFFLFDSAQILARSDCLFSDGNLTSPRAGKFSTAEELERLPWNKIYHTGWIDYSCPENADIVFRRNAEAIVPNKLDLSALRYIYCRSDAERETLLYLLLPDSQSQYRNKIVASTRSDLFYRRQTFVESVRLSPKEVYFQFSPETQSPGPFHLRVELKFASDQRSFDAENFKLKRPYGRKMALPSLSGSYTIRLYLDDHLTYANIFEQKEVPL
jgi:hypothetical protein